MTGFYVTSLALLAVRAPYGITQSDRCCENHGGRDVSEGL
jgi:hypothetical protein